MAAHQLGPHSIYTAAVYINQFQGLYDCLEGGAIHSG